MIRLFFILVIIFCASCTKKPPAETGFWVYVSSFSDSTNNAGIGIYDWNPEDGSLQRVGLDSAVKNSSYLSIDTKNGKLYSIDKKGIQSFDIVKETGAISILNQIQNEEEDKGACYISLADNGKYIMVAYYGSGSVATYSIDKVGRIGSLVSQIKHEGSGINKERQEAAHAHMVVAVPSSSLIAITDLGMDKIFCYRISETGEIEKEPVSITDFPPGYGPRHLAFHPSEPYVFVLAELTSRVVGYRYDPELGFGEQVADVGILPEDFKGFNKAADIHISNDGNYLYASNRGANSLAVCKIEQSNGELTLIDTPSSFGEFPRAFAIDPSGDYLLVANKQSNQISILSRDKASGLLTRVDGTLLLTSPQCIRFYKK